MEIHKTVCDRCKKELVEKPVRQFTIYNHNVRVDLCEDCYRFFYAWMKKPDDIEITNKEECVGGVPVKLCEDVDNNLCFRCAYHAKGKDYYYEICGGCYKGSQFIPKKEKECE